MTSYNNENDTFAAEWLRGLIDEGLIAPGHVDQRDIQEVEPADLAGFTQCHFFAGIGGWSLALRLRRVARLETCLDGKLPLPALQQRRERPRLRGFHPLSQQMGIPWDSRRER